MALSVAQYQMYLFVAIGILAIIFFRLRSFIFAWLDTVRSFGGKFLIRVRNPTQDYFVSGRIDKSFLYFKGRKRSDNPSPNRMISITHTFNPVGNKIDKEFSFSAAIYNAFGVRCVDVDDEKDCIIFYKDHAYGFVPGMNTELMDEHVNTALNKPSRLDGFVDNRRFQIFVLIGLGLLLIVGIFIAYNARLIPNIFNGLVETHRLVSELHNVVIVNATG